MIFCLWVAGNIAGTVVINIAIQIDSNPRFTNVMTDQGLNIDNDSLSSLSSMPLSFQAWVIQEITTIPP
jgi:hypothetical protein